MTEKRCSGCGEVKPLADFDRHPNGLGGRTNRCKPCKRAYAQRWRAEHAEEYAERRRVRTAANPQPNRDRAKAWYHANRERARAAGRAAYMAKREERKAAAKRWRDEHPERKRENDRRFRAQNKDRVRAYQQRYRERTRGNPEANARRAKRRRDWVAKFRAQMYERGQGICGICGEPVERSDFHIDHIIPVSLGGAHDVSNMQLAHPRCNRVKGGRLSAPR